ncbi:MAG: hypothetical protein ACRDZX_05285 [Acidimicrobiales bacterium]
MATRLIKLALGFAVLLAVPLASAAKAPLSGAKGTEGTKGAAQILVDARGAMDHLKDFHVLGKANEGTTAVKLNVTMSPHGGGGTIGLPGVTMQIVVASKSVYIKADQKSWLKLTGSKATAQLVANRWIKAARSNPDFADFAKLAVSTSFIAQLTTGGALSKLPGTSSWQGRKAVVLADGKGGRLYVADTGAPYMLHLQGSHGETSGSMSFSDFGDAPMPSVPTHVITLPSA